MKSCKPKSLKMQILRGVTGVALLVAAGFLMPEHYALAFLCFALSFIPFKGCIFCWTFETRDVLRGRKDKP